MHIKRLHVRSFKRFHDLTIEIPGTPRLVVMAGPNGMGKSSLIDAVRYWHGGNGLNEGWGGDETYYRKAAEAVLPPHQLVELEFAEQITGEIGKKLVYARSAYRHEPEFLVTSISRRGDLLDAPRSRRMIDPESKVSDNYQRLVSSALDDLFVGAADDVTVRDVREKHIGQVREAMQKLFPDLELQGPGDPLGGGTFYFKKAGKSEFHYKNLSGGEKAGFDLILDLVIKSAIFDNTVFIIDEPELHLNSRLQGALLELLLELTPAQGQLWVATHSIGMMRKAQELASVNPEGVVFLDFENHDFDQPVNISPVHPNREFWNRVLDVALGDLAALVAPDRVVLCEGRPAGAGNAAKAEFDARCYRKIFADEFPRTDFVSVGNALEVSADRVELGRTIQTLISGTEVIRVVDRDQRSMQEVQDLETSGVRVLSRRHLESYLLDDEIVTLLCESSGQPELTNLAIAARNDAVAASVDRGNAVDDLKSAAGDFYVAVRQLLALVGHGNTTESFLADTMAPLVRPSTAVYSQLRADIFPQ
jgi:predicted ATPase